MSKAPSASAFTGRKRNRTTTWSVRLKDVVARIMITAGGIGTIVAVMGVCLFLVWVVVPLFFSATVNDASHFSMNQSQQTVSTDAGQAFEPPVAQGMDEYRMISWILSASGELSAYNNAAGKLLTRQQVITGQTITAVAKSDTQNIWLLGLSNGSVLRGTLGVAARLIDVTSLPAAYRQFKHDQLGPWSVDDEVGMIQRVNDDQFRILTIVTELMDPIEISPGHAVTNLDFTLLNDDMVMAAMTADGKLQLDRISQRKNILTGKITITKDHWDLPFDTATHGRPHYLLMSGQGDMIYLAWTNGKLLRYDTRIPDEAKIVEEVDLVPEQGEQLTALTMLLGRGTLLAGDSLGRVRGWFRSKPEGATTADGATLVKAHELAQLQSAVVALAPSSRTRIVAAGSADGQVKLFQATSQKELANVQPDSRMPVTGITISPKDDGMLILREGNVSLHQMNVGYPEATLSALFLPVWYENFNQPETTWQSSGGSDEAEAKFGLWPLIFGSLKGTVYCLLFGVPIALFGAIFTSEFLHPRAKAVVKPTIEMMASLPSVVLGFLAALVIAPVAEDFVPSMIASFVLVPCAFLSGAFIWQLMPYQLTLRMGQWRLAFIFLFLPLGLVASYFTGPVFEHILFANHPLAVAMSYLGDSPAELGNLKSWLDGQMGHGAPGWMVILLPVSAIAVAIGGARWINPILRQHSGDWSRRQMALLSIIKFIFGSIAAALLALVCGLILTHLFNWDPRGSIVGTYVQRNALVVGFVMGFAIIPIIYTIAEDALSAVPEHLRAASLGAGGTPWQTAMRIVIPTAMSGLFSAIMIGVGRAVGETMIVLMAAGNTAVTDWNPFNGFRTLSANIAVELPEAVENSTHYRTLYMAALVLFIVTFLLNTVAETIRQRFRKRAFQL